MELGLCKDRDTDLFFKVGKNDPLNNFAKSICRDCPVKPTCYTYALQHNEQGIWGGTDEWERRKAVLIFGPGLAASVAATTTHPVNTYEDFVFFATG